jgi:hypothetical protein
MKWRFQPLEMSPVQRLRIQPLWPSASKAEGKGDPPGLRNCSPRVEGRSPEEQLSSAGEKSLTTSAFTKTAKDPLPKVIR